MERFHINLPIAFRPLRASYVGLFFLYSFVLFCKYNMFRVWCGMLCIVVHLYEFSQRSLFICLLMIYIFRFSNETWTIAFVVAFYFMFHVFMFSWFSWFLPYEWFGLWITEFCSILIFIQILKLVYAVDFFSWKNWSKGGPKWFFNFFSVYV